MKKSQAIPLLLLGSTALLAGCSPNNTEQQKEMRQDAYTTAESCHRDWAPDVCARSGSSGVYLGPRYFYSHGNLTPYVIDRDGSTRAMPSSYRAYGNLGTGTAGAANMSPGRTTIVTHDAPSSHGLSSIFRGGFGGGHGGESSGG